MGSYVVHVYSCRIFLKEYPRTRLFLERENRVRDRKETQILLYIILVFCNSGILTL